MEFKDSQIAWIGQIPKHWEVKKIKYCLKENFGGCWGDDLENEQISQNSRLCIRVADFDFDKQKVKQTADTFRNYTKSQILSTKLQDGDLIIEKSGGGDKMPVGRSVVFEQNLFGAKEVLFANFCQCFRPLNINNKFFAHAMKAFYQNNNMRFFFNQTTGIQNLSIFNIVNAFLAYPPLNEQKKIAEFLDKKCEIIDKRLNNLERKIKSLKEYKKSLISECVTKGLNPKNMEFKDSQIAWIGQIPKHWEVKKIKYCLKENFGGCWGDDLENEQISQNSRLCIRVADFDFDKQKVKQTADTFRNYTKSQILSTKLQDGDLIIEKSGGGDKMPVGRSVVFEQNLFGAKEVLFANFCQCFRPLNINNKFFAHAMKAFYQNNNMRFFFNQTTGIQNLSIFNIVNAFLAYPPLNEQKKIAEFLDKKCEKIDRLNENYTKQITALKEYKKSLIYECVTGKKDIKG